MKRHILISVVSLAALGPASSLAHDKAFHSSKPVDGEVVSVTENELKLKTSSGVAMITLQPKTRFEFRGATLPREKLKPGDHVSVLGTKLVDGMVAHTIRIHPAGQSNAHDPKTGRTVGGP